MINMATTPATILATMHILDPPDESQPLFSWFDYSLFGVMLAISAVIGIYFGFFGKKQDNIAEYILGGKTMHTFPIAMSLVASEISGTTILAVPPDIYSYGASYWLSSFAMIFAGLVTAFVFLPVFYKLQLTSSYEYLTHRFDRRVRLLSSFFFVFSMFTHMPIVVYVPALAFNQVTGVNVHLITPIVCIICIFYTTVGGLKAVVWTDTLQFTVMITAMIAVLFLGFRATGSVGYVFQTAYDGGRLFLWDLDPDPTSRTSLWVVVIGMGTTWSAYMSCSQNCIQKFLALPSIEKGRRSIVIFIIGMFVVKSLCVITALIIFAKYSDCDPLTTNKVKRVDQLLPYFMMDVAGKIPGLPGLFIAGVFAAALSTISASLNSLTGVLYEDFIKPHMPADTTEKRASDIMKCIVVIVGVISTSLVFIVEHLGNILPLAISLGGMTDGPLLGMFSLGMLVPFANTKGTLAGAITGVSIIAWIGFGAQYYLAQGAINHPKLPISVDGCDYPYFDNVTSNITFTVEPIITPWIHRVSFYYYSLIGGIITISIGVVVSLLTGGRNQIVNRDLLSPVIYFLLPQDDEKCKYNTVEHAIELTTTNIAESEEKT